MRLIACGLVADVAEVRRRGPADPLLGRLLDAGSYGTVEGVAGGPQGLDEVLGGGLGRRAAAAGVGIARPSWPAGERPASAEGLAGGPGAASLVVWDGWRQVDDVALPAAEAAWDRYLGAGAAVSLVVADGLGRMPPLWLLCSFRLPSMGPVAGVVRDDMWVTWLRLAGAAAGAAGAGRYLLEEDEPAGVDLAGEAALTERLRQLYGE